MNLNQKTLIWGLSMYSLGWLILIIKGMGIIEIFGWSLCFAGIFSLSTTIALRLNDVLYTEGEKIWKKMN